MPERREVLAWLAAACAGAASATAQPVVPPFSVTGGSTGWRHQPLPKVERANEFAVVAEEGRPALHVRSASSASSWVAPTAVDAQRLPFLRWRWKVSRSLAGSDLRSKQGDDYAARLYVFFDLSLERLSLGDRLRIQASRALSGVEVPAAALCYVWGGAQPVGTTAWNPYTDRVRMIVVDSGDGSALQWRAVSRDLRRDWQEAFGGPLPMVSGVAVGADTDNTGDSVQAWFADLEFSRSA